MFSSGLLILAARKTLTIHCYAEAPRSTLLVGFIRESSLDSRSLQLHILRFADKHSHGQHLCFLLCSSDIQMQILVSGERQATKVVTDNVSGEYDVTRAIYPSSLSNCCLIDLTRSDTRGR